MSHLFLGFAFGGRSVSPVCFDRIDGLWDELAAIAFVSGQFTVGVHLTLESIEEVWTCGD
jgi:hypothetical protein